MLMNAIYVSNVTQIVYIYVIHVIDIKIFYQRPASRPWPQISNQNYEL